MTVWLFLGAALLSLIWLLIHVTTGEREIARPMLAATELNDVVRETQYLCWHFTSVSIACISGFFVASVLLGDVTFALVGTVLASGFAVSGIALVQFRQASHFKMPQGWLFVPVAVLGILGLKI